VDTHPEQLLWSPGSDWGLGALLKGTSVVGIKGGREHCSFTLHFPACIENQTKSDSLNIRSPLLPKET